MLQITTLKTIALAAVTSALLAACSTTSSPDAPAAEPAAAADQTVQTQAVTGSWRDDFTTLDTTRWSVSGGSWTPFWARDGLTGLWNTQNVTVKDGYLVMKLDVTAGLLASGAEVATSAQYGYGTYEARVRAASSSADPSVAGTGSSGNISAFFNYVNNSETEIDHEIEGQNPTTDWMGAWQTTARHDYGTGGAGGANLTQAFHTYRWDWSATKIDFYIDGVLKRTTTGVLPSAAAHLMLNLWPTNSTGWGGVASLGTSYMLVDYVSFTPAGAADTTGTTPVVSAPTDDTAAGAVAFTKAAPAQGTLSSADTRDWFSFTSTDAGGLSTVSVATDWNSDLEIYAADGATLLGSSRRSKASTDSVTLTLKPNTTYYARVVWSSRAPAYTLSATGAVR
ncbi:glycoside hydrolase family 16 protein (plasmid) [Deinococcus taeanensis]|uniref:glycoside hydrolase family 16 protein n=1 Tax=Deinococcus taeanensis TaxID=2737050 RepID=UPI001CDC7447|nr:glycoside hydrolase family 16 protein [Deinococcus taeanensis]UBV44898.1 glycoside hydrolase family 16 protein [Deinococcus taeanensis]